MSWKIQLTVFTALLAFRTINGLILKTFFQPDEFFQSLEPAWHWTFGSMSGAWITWEWKESLRASMHPLLFSAAYKAADLLCGMLKLGPRARGDVLVATPRLLQAIFAAAMDLFTWRLAGKVYGRQQSKIAWAALILSVVSPWQWFCSVRSFSNSAEATLTVVALDLFPWTWFLDSSPSASESKVDSTTFYSQLQLALVAAATACILRPTNVVIWAAISACLVLRRGTFDKIVTLLECTVVCGGAVLAISAGMDKMFYADWTFPALRFLYFNVVQSLAVFYGRNRWDYYLTEGLPLLLTTALPFGILALWQSIRGGLLTEVSSTPAATTTSSGSREIRFIFSSAIIASIFSLTLVAHKEVRFIYPLLPILHVLAAGPIKTFFDTSPFAAQRRKMPALGSPARLTILTILLVLNILIAGYVSQYHQRGVMDVVHYLRDRQTTRLELTAKYNITLPSTSSTSTAPTSDLTVAFLMPCHSTPWRSHLVHPSIDAWALTCEPPLDLKPSQRATYLDEADQFYADPSAWMAAHMRSLHTIAAKPAKDIEWDQLGGRKLRKWPMYVVFFEQLEPTMQTVLEGSMYEECRRFWNSHWHDDGRRKGDVVVYCLKTVDETSQRRGS
jgi:phosphatidylinositol glycan class B